MLAGLLYLGAGLLLGVVDALRPGRRAARETPLRPVDRWLLLAITLLGGVVAPVLMLVGLGRDEPHAHAHRHEPITHDHPHLPDGHHRHRH